jgi:small-conductance mechanosensitive channel
MNYLANQKLITDFICAVSVTITVYLAIYIAKRVLIPRLEKNMLQTDDKCHNIALDLIRKIHPVFWVVLAVYIGTLQLSLSAFLSDIIRKTFIIILLLQTGRLVTTFIRLWIDYYKTTKINTDAGAITTLNSVGFLLRILLWIILLLIALDNFGVNVTTLIAGLGIGGIAVALAVQNILSDLFASFSIVLDKPFVIGDFIIVDDLLGTVEYVGIKTTRIRSLSGEQLIFSNADLLKSRIRNFKRMYERRVVFSISIVYQTPIEKIEAIPLMIRRIIEDQGPVRFDRAHFKEYGTYSLNFEIVYWIKDPDYNIYMDTQQAINIAIYKLFREADIEFAYPTQIIKTNGRSGLNSRPG